MKITLEQIKSIAKDIIADKEWVNDSSTECEHMGIRDGLYRLIGHLEVLESDEPHCECQCCGKRITIGESFQYETSGYTTYCDNTECTEGVATVGSLLEPCWFGDDDISTLKRDNALDTL